MKNFIIAGIGNTEAKIKKKQKKMSTIGVDLDRLDQYSENYIRKTSDFNNIDKVELILVELAKQKEDADIVISL